MNAQLYSYIIKQLEIAEKKLSLLPLENLQEVIAILKQIQNTMIDWF